MSIRDRSNRQTIDRSSRPPQDRSGRQQIRQVVRFRQVSQQWDFENTCNECGFLWLKSQTAVERSKCCKGGYVFRDEYAAMQPWKPFPANIKDMMFDDVGHFSANSALYNRMLSIADTVLDNGRNGRAERFHGDSAYTINGCVTYFLRKDALIGNGGLSYFTYDGLSGLQNHANAVNGNQSAASRARNGPRAKEHYLAALYEGLKRDNKYCVELQRIGNKIIRVDNYGIPIVRLPTDLIATINNENNFFEVAAFSADNARGNKSFKYSLKGTTLSVNARDPNVEPLCFPLLFWDGCCGYKHERKKELPFHDYLRARLLCPEPNWFLPSSIIEPKDIPGWNLSTIPMLALNRAQLLSRVTSVYVVETVSRALDFRLGWHRGAGKSTIFGCKNTTTLLTDEVDNDIDEHCEHAENGRETYAHTSPSFLADSFTGSPRHLKALAKNALVIVSELGPPTVFITLTCNSKDPAILCRCFKGQTAFDRPEIVTQVFHAQLQAFLYNLRHGKYFAGKVNYLMYVIEYQHRGLPHAHLVCQIDGIPTDQDGKLDWVSKNIHAHFPPPDTDPEYSALIMTHNIHKCASAVNGCLNADGKCKRGYHDLTINAEDSFTDRGYVVYCRPTYNDLRVVPHNRDMLKDWGAHLNVEFCGHTYAILYLYKYLFKGNQKVSLNLNNTSDVDEMDEIKLMQRGRMLCSMQAWWLIWGYQNYPASSPSAKLIKAKLPYVVQDLAYDSKTCDMAIYFARPDNDEMRYLKYTEFFTKYDYTRQLPKYAQNKNYEIVVNNKLMYIYETRTKHIVRMGSVPFGAGEIFWLRLLLYKRAAHSYLELRTVEDHVCLTFQEAALRLKYTEESVVAEEMFIECIIDSSPHELRILFTNMTIQGFPTIHIYNNSELRRHMCSDFIEKNDGNIELAENQMLLQLAKFFKLQANAALGAFGLPEPKEQATELQLEQISYDCKVQKQLAETLIANHPLTNEMMVLFDDIQNALNNNEPFIAILQGIAGSGKSTFVKYVMAYVRSLGYVAKGCASTGLAASVYDDFSTAHSLFAIPVMADEEEYDQEGDLKCALDTKKYEQRADLLNVMKLCAWDEVSSQHMRDIRAVIDAMSGFKGKILLFVGDGLQITPVVKGGNKASICASSIYCSELMRTAKYYQFTKVLRLQNIDIDPKQARYARLLYDISVNTLTMTHDCPSYYVGCDNQKEQGIMRLYIPNLNPLFKPEECIRFCHPQGFNTNLMHKSCILASTNLQVDFWNSEVQKLNQHPEHILLSKDTINECDDPHGYLKGMVTEEVMNNFTESSVAPPHKLLLKLHDICILMRAVSKVDKLATNTRVRITGISNNIIRVTTLDTVGAKSANLPRFIFNLKLPYGKSFTITRRQFPLRLAYSLSINRSQGQTLERVVVDLTNHCFMHGHLNVAMSRIRNADNMAVYILQSDYDEQNKMVLTTNVVYSEIIDALRK